MIELIDLDCVCEAMITESCLVTASTVDHEYSVANSSTSDLPLPAFLEVSVGCCGRYTGKFIADKPLGTNSDADYTRRARDTDAIKSLSSRWLPNSNGDLPRCQ